MKKIISKRIFSLCMISLMLLIFSSQSAFANIEHDYITNKKGKKIAIPVTYSYEKTFSYLGQDIGHLNKPQDMFIADNKLLYIADTGNNRIVKMTLEGEVIDVFYGPEDKPFNEPYGVFVDRDGDIYVADTGNSRIAHISPEGKFVEEFVKPDSALYDSNYMFRPLKVSLDNRGYIYIINKEDYHGFIILDAYNRFRGYMAPTKLEFSLKDQLIRMFASKQQKEKIAKRLPPVHSNFVINSDGMFYTTTLRAKQDQIKKLTTTGDNIFPWRGTFGETINDLGKESEPSFVDICVNKNNIISVIDQTLCKVYQYDMEGNLLTVFGGSGNWAGKFLCPTSIVEDIQGNIYVLDEQLNNLQVFKPTKFIKTVHEGLRLYYDGKYKEAVKPWKEILKIGPGYNVAHKGMAKAFMKQEDYKTSMKEYKLGEDKKGYSKAFSEYRHSCFRKYFGLVVLIVVAIIVILVKIVLWLRKRSQKILETTRTWKEV